MMGTGSPFLPMESHPLQGASRSSLARLTWKTRPIEANRACVGRNHGKEEDMTFALFASRVSRRPLLAMSAALSLGIMSFQFQRAIARQASPEPALLVRGEIVLPADAQLAWRIVREEAEMPQD